MITISNFKQVGKNILDIEKTEMYSCDIVMEPGSFHVDGEGTARNKKEEKQEKKWTSC